MRFDTSHVPLQGGYVAKRCPVRAQNDVLLPGEPLSPSPFLDRLFRQGREFEASVVAELVAANPGATVIADHGDNAEAKTLAAMDRGDPLIIGARLPVDTAGRRVGRPDLLVAATGRGYRAVDIKHHMAIAPLPAKAGGFPAILASLAEPGLPQAFGYSDLSARKNEADLLQLAHYQRMLEAVGLAAGDGRWGGIVGTERQVAWYDLDIPAWRTRSTSEKTKLRTTMERYDFEYAFRLDVIAVAEKHKVDPSVELLVRPVKITECASCPWWAYCRRQLEEGFGDVSLLPGIGYTEWRVHRDHGITNRARLAALDIRAAGLVAAKVEVNGLLRVTEALADDVVMSDVEAITSESHLPTLLSTYGIENVGDLRALDPVTLTYCDDPMVALPQQIDLARSALGPEPAYRRRGVESLVVPRADVEVDIDMENVEDGCYLWGCLVTDRAKSGLAPEGYRGFVTWDALTLEVEARNSLAFWTWLMEVRTAVRGSGLSFRAYCYNAPAENQFLRRLGLLAEIENDVEEFITSDEWVDMLRVWTSQLITGGPSGLKLVAPIVGFQWPVADPDGGESMLMYELAVSAGPQADAAREWLVAYNRGDVEATLAIRDWLNGTGRRIPSISSLDSHSNRM